MNSPARRNGPPPGKGPRGLPVTEINPYSSPIVTLVVQGLGDPGDLSLLEVGRLTGVHPQLLLYYCRLGLLAPADGHLWDGPTFDRDAVAQVLRIEHYRDTLGVKRRALHLICELWREAERQQIDLEFLHANSARH